MEPGGREAVVGEVAIAVAEIFEHPRRARSRPGGAESERVIESEDAHPVEAGLHGPRELEVAPRGRRVGVQFP